MIADGQYAKMNLSTALNSPIMVQDAIQMAVNMLNGIYPEGNTVLGVTVVNGANVEEYLDPENTVF